MCSFTCVAFKYVESTTLYFNYIQAPATKAQQIKSKPLQWLLDGWMNDEAKLSEN